VADAGRDDGFTLKARDERRIAKQRPVEDLDGDVAVDAQLSCAIDTRHRTLTDELFDAEVFVDDSPDERVSGVIEPCGLWHAASSAFLHDKLSQNPEEWRRVGVGGLFPMALGGSRT
jgi:hypothetical protein